MKILWNRTYWIEKFLLTPGRFGKNGPSGLLNVVPGLRDEMHLQKKVYDLLKMHHRQKLKRELYEVSRQIFHNPEYKTFQQEIDQIFKH
ncbi:MAG: hypothetical protein IPL46_27905 [Saprospiraceae bacterium]|nr:hypothetical protein [Saprospiraceae bacterium]